MAGGFIILKNQLRRRNGKEETCDQMFRMVKNMVPPVKAAVNQGEAGMRALLPKTLEPDIRSIWRLREAMCEMRKGDFEMRPEELKDTIEMMENADYKERFKAEYYQNVIRYEKLKTMLNKWDRDELNFEPTCPRSTYNMQIRAMTDYIAVLEARAVMEEIDL